MTTHAEIIRAHGTNLRVEVVNIHSRYGNQVGRKVLARFLHEVASCGSEIHGRAEMIALFQSQLYALNAGGDEPPAITEPEPTVIDLVEAPAAEVEQEVIVETKLGWRRWVPDADVLYFLGGILTGVIASAPYL